MMRLIMVKSGNFIAGCNYRQGSQEEALASQLAALAATFTKKKGVFSLNVLKIFLIFELQYGIRVSLNIYTMQLQ